MAGMADTPTEPTTASARGDPPPRLLPGRPLPAYAYTPGETPHPTRDPDGHSHVSGDAPGHLAAPETPAPPDPADWRASADYCYGVDLFNHGYFWEAHEAWEGLWVACGREGPRAAFFQGLVNLAAAGFKARLGNARGVRANAATAHRLFRAALGDPTIAEGRFMGLDVRRLADAAQALAEGRAPFDIVLRPA